MSQVTNPVAASVVITTSSDTGSYEGCAKLNKAMLASEVLPPVETNPNCDSHGNTVNSELAIPSVVRRRDEASRWELLLYVPQDVPIFLVRLLLCAVQNSICEINIFYLCLICPVLDIVHNIVGKVCTHLIIQTAWSTLEGREFEHIRLNLLAV